MYQDSFEKLDKDEVQDLLKRMSQAFESRKFDAGHTIIMARELLFYPGFRYLEIVDYSLSPPLKRYVLHNGRETVVLNTTNGPIYELNVCLPIKLDKKNVCDYVRFFFFHVRGEHGAFVVCENVDDIPWKDEPPPAARKAIGKMIVPVTLINKDRDGPYTLKATMVFKDSLFSCDLIVSEDGYVELDKEELLVEDMPLLDDLLLQ